MAHAIESDAAERSNWPDNLQVFQILMVHFTA